ncbi:hypothetical protein NMY22_g6618 [Coprinellus aureogranulatus]|nr:hypothetical protein NMY22_g6618 [Coprinellus aureogranulatus]
MLLSPPLATVWTPKIKRIILDEIHSIGHQEGGAVWEQILLLAPCPIIGLSATIGSPELFNDWLAKVQEAHGFKHTFVRHPHRYSHLRKFFYVIKDEEEGREFISLSQHKSTERSRFIHPISALSFGRATIPDDLALEAKDTLTLYRAFRTIASRRGLTSDALGKLDPKTFFSGNKLMLRQRDVLEYEAQLKGVMTGLLGGSGPFIGLSLSDAPNVGLEVVAELQDPALKAISSTLDVTPGMRTFKRNLIQLLADLHVQNELPAILFNYDRTGCEFIGNSVGECLEDAEERYKETSPAWRKKLEQWEVWKAGAKERAARMEKQKKRKGSEVDQGNAEDQSAATWTWEQSFDPDQVLPEFSFANYRSSYAVSELEQDIEKLSWGDQVPAWAFSLLRRGIGVHHAGMNKGYRSLVEALFRRGFLRVVVATGTLALGINAPAKTTVFCADSPYLTALEYRQCAGRAGRRGYDLLGNVIFYGLPMDRVQRLMLSKLPILGGGFPLTSTLVLRLCNLLEESNRAPNVVKAIDTLMSMPRVSFASDVGHDYLVHHVQFSIEYLRRNGLLNEEGKPMNLFAIAGHLYYAEPSNLALVGLLRAGVLHTICKGISVRATDSDVRLEEAKRTYILLMAHLFGRRLLPKALAENEEELRRLTSKYPSKIVLPPMPTVARKAIQRQADDILEVFVGYARAFAMHHLHSTSSLDAAKLPLSGAKISPETGSHDGGSLTEFLRQSCNTTNIRSAFVANSGLQDNDFTSVQELADTVRTGIHLNAHAIPCLDDILSSSAMPSKGQSSNTVPGRSSRTSNKLNAYLLDFYLHGQKDTIVNANNIRRNDMWYLIEDFRLVLLTVKSSLEQLLLKAGATNTAATTEPKGQGRTIQKSNCRKKSQPMVVSATGEWDDSSEDESEEETMLGSDNLTSPDETLVGVEELVDSAEFDGDEEEEGPKITNFKRPRGVTNEDWSVYRVVSLACAEFDEKARAIRA